MRKTVAIVGALSFSVILPFMLPPYFKHISILILVWAGISTAWAYTGRFGILSLGHGAILGIGAYVTVLLFNFYGLSPWIGMLLGAFLACMFFTTLSYFCFRFRVVGHYFAVMSLVETIIIYLLIIIFREFTGGALGINVNPLGTAPLFFQFENKTYFYFIALAYLLLTLYIWQRINTSKVRRAMIAIGDDEDAASSVGIPIVKYKTGVTAISSFITSLGGVVYTQYMMFLHPDVLASTDASLNIPFKAILGGMFNLLGPLVGSSLVIGLEEYFRVAFGSRFIGWSMVPYGIVLVVIIIFLPKGLYGSLKEFLVKRREQKRVG
jgi:branched-chain amino acid transport system permease protein